MYVGAFGVVHDPETPPTVDCRACGGRATRLGSRSHGPDRCYHHYRCERDDCPAGGTLVTALDDGEVLRRVGPVFGGFDLPTRLAARGRPETPAEPGARA